MIDGDTTAPGLVVGEVIVQAGPMLVEEVFVAQAGPAV